MPVNTKKAQGRRNLRYESLGDLLADAEQMASTNVSRAGNWSLGQILQHVTMSLDSSIDGFDVTLPVPLRLVMNLFLKKKFIYKSFPAGIKTFSKFVPDEDATAADGVVALRKAVERQQIIDERVLHPAFGKITNDEWTNYLLRHAEMHMSFVIPVEC